LKLTAAEPLRGAVVLVGAIWAAFLLGKVLPFPVNSLGVTPRTFTGLTGVIAAPFLHANLRHLINNTVPLLVLLTLLVSWKGGRWWTIVLELVLLSGLLLWLVGRPATHLGASSLIFGLITFMIVSGVLERRLVSLAVSILVGFLYGGTILGGIVPRLGSAVSWEGHLCGAVAGGVVAYIAAKGAGRRDWHQEM
jgi:membrane associated rhomboid family serine protease